MDFVEDFVRPGTEDELRSDVEPISALRDHRSHRAENVHRLIIQLRFCGALRRDGGDE
jgi:hypothetical protein